MVYLFEGEGLFRQVGILAKLYLLSLAPRRLIDGCGALKLPSDIFRVESHTIHFLVSKHLCRSSDYWHVAFAFRNAWDRRVEFWPIRAYRRAFQFVHLL